ncbi:MAG: CRISPR-associated endonuclease Cas1, partial [Clostridia bacterium]|nr:CRISPR-associated endonuclease Cas1 [Clostridia bacterium]
QSHRTTGQEVVMSYIYLYEHGAKISVQNNRIVVEQKRANLTRSIPIEGVESVCIIGEVAFTSPCIKEFLGRGIQLTWLSPSGEFFGKLSGTNHQNVLREAAQFDARYDEAFCLEMAKKWTGAKMRNQRTLLRRYSRFRDADVQAEIDAIGQCIDGIESSPSINALMGHEGVAARHYFSALSRLTEPDFRFDKRTRQPPRDPFNSMLSFAYTLLLHEINVAVSSRGLHPYVGCMHALRNGHPALCSDLMEEWRPVIADSLVMSVVAKQSIKINEFDPPDSRGGVYLKPDACKRFLAEYEEKLRVQAKYLSYADFPVSFRRAIELQTGQFVKALEARDASIYQGVIIR